LAEVCDAVRSAWANAHRIEESEKFYQNLLKRYDVTIEASRPLDYAKKLAQDVLADRTHRGISRRVEPRKRIRWGALSHKMPTLLACRDMEV
jgi:hypothetical protein